MSLFGSGKKNWRQRSSQPPSLEATLNQTASDLAKQAKLKIATDALLLSQMQALASDEVSDSRRLKAKHLGEQFANCARGGGDAMGDIFICDDYHQSHGFPQPPRTNWLGVLAVVLAAVAVAGSVGAWLGSSRVVAVQKSTVDLQPQFQPVEFDVQVQWRDGKWTKEVTPVRPGK